MLSVGDVPGAAKVTLSPASLCYSPGRGAVIAYTTIDSEQGGVVSRESSGRVRAGQDHVAERACLLAGSIGAPAGLGRFFRAFDRMLPIAFIVVVPISPNAVPLLCDYLSRFTKMRVLPALTGHILHHGEVIVVPSDRLLIVDENNHITLVTPDADLTNPIDLTMKAFSRHFRANLGAIIFSGIGEDGLQGCQSIVDNGGEVWTQAAESCHFASMPRYVSEACEVRYSGTPEQLASRLQGEFAAWSQHYRDVSSTSGAK
jgi:chemosensory pili system protein ChpB (putative protein-glutamate methylesterase)